MPKSVKEIEQEFMRAQDERNERLRMLITARFPGRGVFRRLEEASGISDLRWKNFFYRKQDAAEDMLVSWGGMFPEDRKYLESGRTKPAKALSVHKANIEIAAKAKELGIPKNLNLAQYILGLEKRITELERIQACK